MVGGGSYPNFYRRSGELALANYDFTDIAEGTGIIKFYGLVTSAGYVLTRETLFSHLIETSLNTGSSSYVTVFNHTFQIPFNVPKNIKGNAYFNIPAFNDGSGSGTDKTIKTTITVYHYNGSTQTSIGTVNSEDNHTGTIYTTGSKRVKCLSATLTQKQFKKGEYLQVDVKVEGKNNGGGSTTFFVSHDPANRIGSTAATGLAGPSSLETMQMSFYIPFIIDTT